MNYEEMSDEQLKEAHIAATRTQEAIAAVMNTRRRIKEAKVEERLTNGSPFSDDELLYAATARCKCGAGYAYPKDIGMRGYWECADILTGRAVRPGQPGAVPHSDQLLFMFYEVKSENQPSARGATTRPSAPDAAKEGGAS